MTKSPYDEGSTELNRPHRDSTKRASNGHGRNAEDPGVAGLSPTEESMREKDEEYNETRAGLAGENE